MYNKSRQLEEKHHSILLNNTGYNLNQIKEKIIKEFEPKGNDINFCRKNLFIKKYFQQKNVQGIFNRIEWKFVLKQDIRCELCMSEPQNRQQGQLEMKISLEFSSSRQLVSLETTNGRRNNTDSHNFTIDVSFEFCPDDTEIKDRVTDSKVYASKNLGEYTNLVALAQGGCTKQLIN